MKNPYQIHAWLESQSQAFLGGQPGDGNRLQAASLTIWGIAIPCTHSPIVRNWVLESGQSSITTVEVCKFLASDLPASVPGTNPAVPAVMALVKGLPCQLKVNPALPNFPMQLWSGGLEPGGLVYAFMLVDANYRG